jgi:hypothetical protein
MATHDYDIANQSGANFRADLNNVLDAIVSNNSNSSDPSTTFAYMWWVDTSNNVLKLRNSANNAWITLPMSITASNTITPTLNMGTGAEEDVKIVYDGNAKDFYIALDDSADVLIIGEGSTVGTNAILTITDDSITIGDGAAVDTKIVYNGNAQDYYVGLDDSDDKLKIGVGSTVGTTPALSVDSSQNLEIEGTLNTLGFKGPRGNFTNSMLISDDATTGTLSSASNNTGFGRLVFNALTSGTGNTAVGADALAANTTGLNNIAIGLDALKANTIGFQNTVAGVFAMDGAVAASRNTAFGYAALSNVTAATATDTENTAVGGGALQVTTAGLGSTAVGRDAGLSQSTGTGNTYVGKFAGANLTTGSDNVFIGKDTGTQGESSSTNSNCIYIGEGASGNNNAQNEYVIGQDRIGLGTNTFAFGKTSNVVYNVFTSNNSWIRSSDLHKKTNIENTDIGLSFINELQPVTFNWRPNNEFPEHFKDYSETDNHMETDINLYGMIAQDVEKALDKVGHKNFGGWVEEKDGSQSLSQEMFVYPLINAVKELSEKCDSLQKEINELKGN